MNAKNHTKGRLSDNQALSVIPSLSRDPFRKTKPGFLGRLGMTSPDLPTFQTVPTKGFTLIELLVAIGIFSILVAIGVGGFVHALHTQREIASLIAAQNNASVALEQVTREIRTGYLFCHGPENPSNPGYMNPNGACQLQPDGTGCTTNSTGGWTCNNILDFYNAQGQNVDYKVLPGGALARSQNGDQGTFVPITGSDVDVSYLVFTLFGNQEGDHWNPRITISMGVGPNSTDPAIENDILNVQTTVSAREIDCVPGSSPAQC